MTHKLRNYMPLNLDKDAQKRYGAALAALFCDTEIIEFVNENKFYAQGIKNDVLRFITKTDEKIITSEKPFDDALDLFDDVIQLKKKEFLSIWKHITQYINQDSNIININFFEKEFDSSSARVKRAPAGAASKKFNAARRLWTRTWQRELKNSEDLWEKTFVQNEFKKFVLELREKIINLKFIAKTFSLSKEDSGRLWNNSRGKWQRAAQDMLSEYEKVFSSDTRLARLAKELGRARVVDAESDTPQNELLYVSRLEGGAARAELCGTTIGGALDTLMPSEFVFLASKELENVFFDKWIRKKLLCYEYSDNTPVYGKTGDARHKKRFAEGPFIICIDTSGSMRGAPERAAKALVFALLKCALKTKRLCYLISFSTEIATLELSSLGNSLDALIEFLSNSFYGGSQLVPALRESLMLLEREAYRAADILVVSDFILPPLEIEIENKLKSAQKHKTRFFALLTGSPEDSVVNHSLLNLFDKYDVYDVL